MAQQTQPVYIRLLVSENVDASVGNDFKKKVMEVLTDPRGWSKYGYKFVDVESLQKPVSDGFTIGGIEFGNNNMRGPDSRRVLDIGIVTLSEVQKLCDTVNLSCYVPLDHKIFINADNWAGNSPISKEVPAVMTLDEYRTYVINHEVGHSLQLEHPQFTTKDGSVTQCNSVRANKPGSVMMQMSKGSAWIAPCKPNCWPLDPAEYNEFTHTKSMWPSFDFKNDVQFIAACLQIILLFILVCIIASGVSRKGKGIQIMPLLSAGF